MELLGAEIILSGKERDALPDCESVGAIDDHDVVSFSGERQRAGKAAPPGSDHHHRLVGHDAGPATRANRTVIAAPAAAAAAKAATSRCSRSPSSSK